MSKMLALLTISLLSMQWVVGDDVPRLPRQHSSAAVPHVLSQLLVPPSARFALRDNGSGCPTGWHACPNFPNECSPDGSFCCTSVVNCPNNTNCSGPGGDQCCPQDAQTCGGQTCCNAGATCCSGNQDCCDSGNICCNDSFGGCCPVGQSCASGSDTCLADGSSGSGSGNGNGSGNGSGSIPTMTFTGISESPTTSAASSGFGGLNGSPHSVSMMSTHKTAGLATLVGTVMTLSVLF